MKMRESREEGSVREAMKERKRETVVDGSE